MAQQEKIPNKWANYIVIISRCNLICMAQQNKLARPKPSLGLSSPDGYKEPPTPIPLPPPTVTDTNAKTNPSGAHYD